MSLTNKGITKVQECVIACFSPVTQLVKTTLQLSVIPTSRFSRLLCCHQPGVGTNYLYCNTPVIMTEFSYKTKIM